MELNVFVHGRLALSLDANPAVAPNITQRGPAVKWLSSVWDGREDVELARRWLSCCLPENGRYEAWMANTAVALRQQAGGGTSMPRSPETLLWAHANFEYPGAVSLTRDDAGTDALQRPIPLEDYERLDEPSVEGLLRSAIQVAGEVRGNPRESVNRPNASLSGVRPKISLSTDGTDNWRQGPMGQLNTWILKVEDSPRNPAEAGVESICQLALGKAGIRAAETRSRVVGGIQCVLSRREDRKVVEGRVLPIHQEDFRQASNWGTPKYPGGLPNEPEWPTAYRILNQSAEDPGAECEMLTRLLAASWLMAHGDFHRGNLGFSITPPASEQRAVSLAPAYDVSSAAGTKYSKDLVFPVGGQAAPHQIGFRQWRAHAEACRIDVERTLDAVADTIKRLPDAFADARAQAAKRDENRLQREVDARAELTQRHIKARANECKEALRREAKRRAAPSDPSP